MGDKYPIINLVVIGSKRTDIKGREIYKTTRIGEKHLEVEILKYEFIRNYIETYKEDYVDENIKSFQDMQNIKNEILKYKRDMPDYGKEKNDTIASDEDEEKEEMRSENQVGSFWNKRKAVACAVFLVLISAGIWSLKEIKSMPTSIDLAIQKGISNNKVIYSINEIKIDKKNNSLSIIAEVENNTDSTITPFATYSMINTNTREVVAKDGNDDGLMRITKDILPEAVDKFTLDFNNVKDLSGEYNLRIECYGSELGNDNKLIIPIELNKNY